MGGPRPLVVRPMCGYCEKSSPKSQPAHVGRFRRTCACNPPPLGLPTVWVQPRHSLAQSVTSRAAPRTTVVAMSDKPSSVPESSVVVRPEPIDSETYTVSSRLQAAGLRPAIALFEQAADTVPLPRPPQPIVIADYGASTGHNSLLPISAAIPVLRNRTRPEHSVLVVHTDVPDNNFTVLFETLAEDPDTYLRQGCRDLRLRRRAVVLQPDHPVQQRAPGLVLVGDPMAEPGACADSRPRAGGLQRRRSGARRHTPSRPRTTGTSSSHSAVASCVPADSWW